MQWEREEGREKGSEMEIKWKMRGWGKEIKLVSTLYTDENRTRLMKDSLLMKTELSSLKSL